MTLTDTRRGLQTPRIGPPPPDAPNLLEECRVAAAAIGITLMPWQEHALSVQTSMDDAGHWLYYESADIVSRQNGKSSLIAPRVRVGLERGERILHTAQNRIIPREALLTMAQTYKKGEVKIREANGQEEIRHPSGGRYTIIAPKRGVRGHSADLLIIDEVREYEDFSFMAAAEPTVTASSNPQIWHLSNAGHEMSLVLNDLKARAGKTPGLAYLEWSAAPELDAGDEEGWYQANPAIGYTLSIERLRALYEKYKEAGQLATWETEHLCRWVESMYPRLLIDRYWLQARRSLSTPTWPSMGVSVDPGGRRASAAVSWPQSDGSVGLMLLADVQGDPLDVDSFALDLRDAANAAGVQAVGFDPLTDQHLARYFPNAKPISGQLFANATERFVRDVETGRLAWEHADQVSEDLAHSARRTVNKTAFVAERAIPHRPITAALAAIRSHWLASEPDTGPPSVY